MSYDDEKAILTIIEQELEELKKDINRKESKVNLPEADLFILNKVKEIYLEKNQDYIKLKKKFFNRYMKYSYKISKEEALIISEWISVESDHMVEKTPHRIYEDALIYGCITTFFENKIIGFIGLTGINYEYEIYEVGGLVVNNKYHGLGIGKSLKKKLMEKYKNKMFFSVTNVASVQKINKKLNLNEVAASNIPKKLLIVIENEQKLLEDDKIFVNQKLLSFINEDKDV